MFEWSPPTHQGHICLFCYWMLFLVSVWFGVEQVVYSGEFLEPYGLEHLPATTKNDDYECSESEESSQWAKTMTWKPL